VEGFDEEKKAWKVEFDDGDISTMDFFQLVEAKSLLDASQ